MKLSLEQLSARMRQGETIPSRQTAQVALALSIPSILEQLVVTAMGYIDAAMVGHIGAEATASIGIVSSSTWLLHGVLVGLYTALSIQIAQYLGADRQDDARSVLRQAMLFNVILGVGAALFGLGISPFLPDSRITHKKPFIPHLGRRSSTPAMRSTASHRLYRNTAFCSPIPFMAPSTMLSRYISGMAGPSTRR